MVKIENSNILITGGAGFIGSHIADKVLEKNAKNVVIFDNFSSGKTENISHLKNDKRVKIIRGDVLERNELEKVVKENNIDIIYHMAAELEVFRGIEKVEEDAQINIFGTLNVLNAALKYGIKKVIYASSGAVYGQAVYIPEDENHPKNAHWPYGVSKYSGERYCRQFWELNKLPTNSFRFGIVYGPREWYGRVLTMFIKRLFIENKPPVIFGDGEQRRDYIYVEDVVEAMLLATENENVNGEVFNIGSGKGLSVKQLAQHLIDEYKGDIKPLFDNPEEGKASKYQPERIRLTGELKDFVLDSSKAKKMLGWKPKIDFKKGVKREIDWITENKDLWKGNPRV